jgi:hypothetical protein
VVRNRPLTLIDPLGLVDLNLFRPGSQNMGGPDRARQREFQWRTRRVRQGNPRRTDDRKGRKLLRPKELAGLSPRRRSGCGSNAGLPNENGKSYAKELAKETKCPQSR